MRHAKAEPFAATDHVRELTQRGRRDAVGAGRYLSDAGMVPDHAVVSSAVRAVQTWEGVCEGLGRTPESVVDDAVFTGSPDVVLEALRTAPDRAERLMFVGHNPTTAYLAHLLDDGNGEPGAVARLLEGFPAGALAVFEVQVPWAELGEETGRLAAFHAATR
jgi:phosphohistidine phosphatase